MKSISHDSGIDAMYIKITDSKIVESEEVSKGIIYDIDAENNIVGIEILNSRQRGKLILLPSL